MNDWLRGRHYMLLLGLAPVLHGCAVAPDSDTGRHWTDTASRMKRESTLRAAWRGRPYQSLIDAFGSPRMIMTVPGYRVVRTDVVVYGATDKASNCIDAFTVIWPGGEDEVTVTDYFCR
ncbi:MAG TPA: hypothetical protein VEC35_20760 [Noviherbaspirillum sp.]|nr:hypothetical protein [Noviherbaspirillum sp.]